MNKTELKRLLKLLEKNNMVEALQEVKEQIYILDNKPIKSRLMAAKYFLNKSYSKKLSKCILNAKGNQVFTDSYILANLIEEDIIDTIEVATEDDNYPNVAKYEYEEEIYNTTLTMDLDKLKSHKEERITFKNVVDDIEVSFLTKRLSMALSILPNLENIKIKTKLKSIDNQLNTGVYFILPNGSYVLVLPYILRKEEK